MNKNKEFWITNISNRNVTLSDLNLSIKAMTSVNLLDSRHYSFSEDQLNKSLFCGSLFLKRDKLVKRSIPPQVQSLNKLQIDKNVSTHTKPKSIFQIKVEKYEELELPQDDILTKEFEAIASTIDEISGDTPPPTKK